MCLDKLSKFETQPTHTDNKLDIVEWVCPRCGGRIYRHCQPRFKEQQVNAQEQVISAIPQHRCKEAPNDKMP